MITITITIFVIKGTSIFLVVAGSVASQLQDFGSQVSKKQKQTTNQLPIGTTILIGSGSSLLKRCACNNDFDWLVPINCNLQSIAALSRHPSISIRVISNLVRRFTCIALFNFSYLFIIKCL